MPSSSKSRKVLLVGWDAADWRFINPLLDAGRLPNLAKLVDHGVIGNLASLKPCLSPILWTSIATGKSADKHGILGFVEPIPGGVGLRPVSSRSRRVKAIWNMLHHTNRSSIVVNWYASHPAEDVRGSVVSNRFFESPPDDVSAAWSAPVGSVSPESKLRDFEGLRFHPRELLLSDLERFVPDVGNVDLAQDPRPKELARELAKTVSIHAVATALMETVPWDFAAILYDGIDTLGHHFMPFHPPQLAGISDPDFARYQHVMTEVYLFHDELLGRLLELAGEDTTVMLISDHGFHSDHQRPLHLREEAPEAEVAAAWHRHLGVLAARGPGIRPDERIYGATLLDITPTVLQIFGLPIGKDMNGKPLLQMFEQANATIETIETWDSPLDVPAEGGAGEAATVAPDVIEHLIKLGYLPKSALDDAAAASLAASEAQFNLAIVHSSMGRHAEAKRELQDLRQRFPDQPRYTFALAKTLANLQDHHPCLKMLRELEAEGQQGFDLTLLMAAELFNVGQAEEASVRLEEAHRRYPPHPTIHFLTGNIHMQRAEWKAALQSFQQALELNSDDAPTHYHAAMAANRLGDLETAADHALHAISIMYFFPQAHFQLGLAFYGLGDLPRAQRSWELAVTQAPRFLEAHQKLADLHKAQGNIPLWVKHQHAAQGGAEQPV
jgi:predicted AlkP superfamily phosphohydrolase/phosphomutase/tetratricopeptide (TPR) repeat protein